MRRQLLVIFLILFINIVLSRNIQNDDSEYNLTNVNNDKRQVETEKVETGQVDTNKNTDGKGETGTDEAGKTESGTTESGKSEVGTGETGTGEAGKTETDKTGTGQTETGEGETGKNDAGKNETDKNETGKSNNGQESTNQGSSGKDNESKVETVKSNVETSYGSVQIEYVPQPPKDNTAKHLIYYFSSLLGIIVVICLVHTIVCLRPKFIAKRIEKRKKKIMKKEQNHMEMLANNSSSNLSEDNTCGLEKLPEAKLKNDKSSPEASIDFTSYNESSTDCIINLDNNSSNNISFNRGKSSGKTYLKDIIMIR
ncbi:hypothetical protein PIROE2DRAFT_6908 [Piromyces sp. E2]|nr:hypothetical protein PIROE2DRAFT_6908 [Piromyces sp. E2]|eukprot:OUM66013.1 hypothetical protein PIROE2DRAFT_6908 [Piromyces sp. E2]